MSDDEFNALKEAVRAGGSDQNWARSWKARQTHMTDEQTHQKDAEQIQQLQEKLGETQKTAVEAEQKAAVPPWQHRCNRFPGANRRGHRQPQLHDSGRRGISICQDRDGQHGSFLLADFAPIFLYRGGDNILFEAGFDFILQNNAPTSPGYTTTVNLSFAQLDYVLNDY